jgi:hypothetical protein
MKRNGIQWINPHMQFKCLCQTLKIKVTHQELDLLWPLFDLVRTLGSREKNK